MATKLPGETYRGKALHVPLSADGQVTAYVWPLRLLNVGGQGCGGPTIGVDVGNEEVLRFDCHDTPGHWHGGGYDRLTSPANSHRSFPAAIEGVAAQVTWALQQIQQHCGALLVEAEHHAAAQMLDPDLIQSAIDAIRTHLEQEGDLRAKAIAENLIAA